jgi:pimeloyl-ACP methyl ester carboxylesterase
MLAVLLCSLVALPGVQSSAGRHEPQAYHIKIDETQRDDIRQRASNFLVTPNIDVPEWYDGPPGPGLGSIAKYWATEFDFQRFEDEINNNFSHYMTTLPPPGGGYNRSLEVHYVHQVSERTDAIPILFLHGWPSTSLEWAEIIPSLVAPPNATLPAFHAVAPDLPGYGFSPAPTAGGLGAQEQAVTFANLMQQLGYERYALYSTDLGAPIAQKFVETFPERIINHVTDFFFITPNATDVARYTANTTTPEETAYIESLDAFGNNHAAYSAVSSTLPLSVAYAFLDSPVGFLAWVWQLVHTVDDRVQTAESLIRRTLLLYLPGPYNNIRSYKELFPSAVRPFLYLIMTLLPIVDLLQHTVPIKDAIQPLLCCPVCRIFQRTDNTKVPHHRKQNAGSNINHSVRI